MVTPLVPPKSNSDLPSVLLWLLELFEQHFPFFNLFFHQLAGFIPEIPCIVLDSTDMSIFLVEELCSSGAQFML